MEFRRFYSLILALALGIVAGGTLESWGATATTATALAITSGGAAVTTVASGNEAKIKRA